MLFIYAWKDSPDIAERVRASSRRQADFRLGQLRGRSWSDDALETGLLYLRKVEKEPAVPLRKHRRSRGPWYARPSKYTDEQIQDMPWNKD